MNPGKAQRVADNWRTAHDWIVRDIEERGLVEGDRLPREPDIQQASGVGRHSVRRALAVLAAEGKVSVEQGRGTFVRARPNILYRIAQRTRFRENLIAQGVTPGGEAISEDIVAATGEVAAALGLGEGALVHQIVRRGLADHRPISVNQSFHSAERFPDMGARRREGESVTSIYHSHGIDDYHRSETVLYARLPSGFEARLLSQPVDRPVMVICKTDKDTEGQPIGYSEAIWAAARVRFALASELEGGNDV